MIFGSNGWVRWLFETDGTLFPILPLLTFSYVNNVLPILQAKFATSPQLQNIMRSAYQRPLTLAGLNSSPHKLAKAASILDLSKHRLDRLASQLIQLAATLGQKLLLHRFRDSSRLIVPLSRPIDSAICVIFFCSDRIFKMLSRSSMVRCL